MTVKSGGVTIAAKNLSISQPSLSGQLKVLEDFLQKKLFKKVGRKNELTRDGAMVYGFCRQMFELSEEMHESITEQIPHASRRVYIGVSNEIAHSFVVEVISHFIKKYTPKLRPKIKMISGTHEKLVEQLRFREIDVLVSQLSAKSSELENLQRVDVPVNLVCTLDKKLSPQKRYMNISSALKLIEEEGLHRWVVPSPGSKLRSEINIFFERESLKGDFVFESDVIESLTRSVVDKVGISFLPLIYIPKELGHKSLYSFGPKRGYWKHRIWLSCHEKSKNDHLVNSLSDSFKKVCIPLIDR
jgi:DNA-binding transcriptional LysR family regulator